MTLVKRNYNNWNNLFDELFNSASSSYAKDLNVPPVNIQENNDAFQVDVVAPGLQKQDFKINVNEGLLTISYEKANEQETKGEKLHRQEYTFKSFKRTFTLDDKINTEAIGAKYENGVLQITLPKKEEIKVQPKEISIA